MTTPWKPSVLGLSIGKRDADCYDVSARDLGRIAALRSDFTEDPVTRERTMIPGTWRIRWEMTSGEGFDRRHVPAPDAIQALKFGSVHEAFAFLCSQVLQ